MNTYNRSNVADVDEYIERYQEFEEEYNPIMSDRRARRKRKPRVNPKEREVAQSTAVAELVDEAAGLEAGFNTTYTPGELEGEWLLDSLRPFYDQQLISDVLALVKGGKEASVYRCAATEETGVAWLAAKVYRPRMFRNLGNDAVYRKGRDTLGENGRPVKKTDHRTMRALGKKSAFGLQVAHTSWLMHEYKTMQKLHAAGANVPRPYATAANAILLAYIGDGPLAAPTLNEVRLERSEAARLCAVVLRNVELLLEHNLIHGDLSAYNILYLDGEVTLIDFPQVMVLRTEDGRINENAAAILKRDITRVCDYFGRQGADCEGETVFRELWRKHARQERDDVLADLSRQEVADKMN